MTPLISIITPFKNTQDFLSECIESILNQTYSHWELLIVDDHSTDDSFALVKKYAANESRIKLFKNSGNGIIPALQLAFAHSSGEYITRMDSDDIMKPHKLDVLITNLLTFGKKHIAIGLVKYFGASEISEGYRKYEKWINKLTAEGRNFSEIYKECVIPSPCWMIHREDFIQAGGFSPNRYPEDYDLTFRFYREKYTIIPCRQVLHRWRDYQTRSSRTQEAYSQLSLLTIRLDYFLRLDYDNSRPLVLWGAGDKGKFIAKEFLARSIDFTWICDNPNKIEKNIYGITLKDFQLLEEIKNAQSIISVANPKAQQEIKIYFNNQGLAPMRDYYFFC